ncbi:MAG: hypothetical protein A2945_01115 [Candidatus Liptonbacteria bacterium RIFCSPLOWO2_01_FULL_52_25]|uniref:Uncharacterized protein n=1 Tax=Candidatus Liptonbacteria bacterium RIFCSPLOWO2_01_FULL_52_25 TaxID=1798650 RepID=A0A1G2CFB4_9BACT|nr:MAG: hypothetical protein A2945_01115 [Candidatus Liptonbacteria bacterium RIFCSPLOWO2_01_FULL_52_25]
MLKRWKLLIVAALFGAVACFYWKYVFGAGLTFIRSELAMLYWMGLGFSQKTAFWIALGSSFATIIGYFLGMEKVVNDLFPKYPRLKAFFARLGIKNGKKKKISPQLSEGLRAVAKKFPYIIVLPALCFDPACGVPLGVGFAKSRGLNPRWACFAMLCGNVAEKILWNAFLYKLQPLGIPTTIAIGVVVALITITISRFYHRHLET